MKNVKMSNAKMSDEKFSCTPMGGLLFVVGLVVMALGLLLLAEGFLTQMNATSFWATLFLYVLGLGALKLGKHLKMRGCGGCAAHGGNHCH